MEAIAEDYVSFETAKLLKEKGFDGTLPFIYVDTEKSDRKVHLMDTLCNYNDGYIKDVISAPTLQMTMKWLREVHHYIIEIYWGNVGSPIEPKMQWWWELENKQGEFLDGNITDGNTTYEQACEAAIKYCLENLIK